MATRKNRTGVAQLALTFCLAFCVVGTTSAHPRTTRGQLEFTSPVMTDDEPAAGKRVRRVAPEYEGTEVHHALYLPTDWKPNQKYPVIVEFTGNKWPACGSTGKVEDANLGYGLTGGKEFIWVSMPCITEDGERNATVWWGDRQATIDYCKQNLPRICEQFGGDMDCLIACGFSRGSISTSHIGLADDEIASMWKGVLAHDHFDGQREWKYPDSDRSSAIKRLNRHNGRPVLVCGHNAAQIRDDYLKDHLELADFEFLQVDVNSIFDIPEGPVIHQHTDLWMHKESTFRGKARAWLAKTVSAAQEKNAKTISWSQTNDRVFLGGDCWANPMEDWTVVDGAAQCSSFGGNRNVHLLTHQLTNTDGSFEMSVQVSQVDVKKNELGAGFKIGIRSDINEHRSNCFSGSGIPAGVVDGKLILAGKTKAFDGLAKPKDLTLKLFGTSDGKKYLLLLRATDSEGRELGSISHATDSQMILGNVALWNNFAKGSIRRIGKAQGSRYRFKDWTVSGDAFTVDESRKFGPLLWTMYSLSDSRGDEGFVLKLSALTGPLGEKDNKDIELLVKKDGQWNSLGSAELDTDAWTATFRIPNWDEKAETPYKVVYREAQRDGSEKESSWTGTIKANPSGRPLRLGALTCQKDYGFPYGPVCENLLRLDPDMLYFSGDQLYEDHGGFGLIRKPADRAILNYLRKYYMHGWAFRDAMRNAPTICLPDDHDVFQGNIWGEAGAAMNKKGGASSRGGYIEPARMVNAVHKTNCGHHPDYYDPTPVNQDISVYYGDMVYGGVSFAIIADRQWKSGPEKVDTASGRADHVTDKDFDTSKLDLPDLVLLGQRQEDFLKQWVDDWRGHSMKVLLSQTVFAGVATHHGKIGGYLKADLDSGAWPQTARDRAIKIIRKGMPLHINGDQHLTSLAQYGVDAQRDGFWSFCTPAISAGYPRWWHPERAGMKHENRPAHGLPHTGEYVDGMGNLVYVYAVGDPEVQSKKNRYEVAHQKGSGFGLVTIDTEKKTYLIESFKFLVNSLDGKASNQFPGWPVTIQQKENNGDNILK